MFKIERFYLFYILNKKNTFRYSLVLYYKFNQSIIFLKLGYFVKTK